MQCFSHWHDEMRLDMSDWWQITFYVDNMYPSCAKIHLLIITLLFLFRHGWMNNGTVAILRHAEHINCANSSVGFIYIRSSDENDAFCYDGKGDYHKKIVCYTCVESCLLIFKYAKVQSEIIVCMDLLLFTFGNIHFLFSHARSSWVWEELWKRICIRWTRSVQYVHSPSTYFVFCTYFRYTITNQQQQHTMFL